MYALFRLFAFHFKTLNMSLKNSKAQMLLNIGPTISNKMHAAYVFSFWVIDPH